MMDASRIFIGNLNNSVKEKHLRGLFSPYGNIENIEIKSKLDVEGNSVSKFAFINLECKPADLHLCVHALNGYSLKGSVIKVEVARETFLARLKREREQTGNTLCTQDMERSQVNPNTRDDSSSHDIFQRKEESTTTTIHENISFLTDHQNDDTGMDIKDICIENESSKPRSYLSCQHKRYDPSQQEELFDPSQKEVPHETGIRVVKKYVQIPHSLEFKESSSSDFSLLDLFGHKENEQRRRDFERSRSNDRIEEEEEDKCNQHPSPSLDNFFISHNDPKLIAGVEWLTSVSTDGEKSQFELARGNLLSWNKIRHKRAFDNPKIEIRGHRENRRFKRNLKTSIKPRKA